MRIRNLLKPSRRKIIILVLLLILGLVGFNVLAPKGQTKLTFAQVKKQDIKSTVSSTGNLTGKSVANLKFKSAGKLAYLNVKVGDTVSIGQTIAGLDTQDLAIALQQAKNTLTDKQATVDKIHDDVKGHDADESFTQRQNRTTAEVAANNAYDGVKVALRAFQDDIITSPIDGIVTQAISTSGQTIAVTDLIAQIVDTSKIYFDTDVDESDIGKVSLGKTAEITLDAYGGKIFKASVEQIKPQTKTTTSGATVVTVRLKILNIPDKFVDGLAGQSSIILEQAKNVLTIPQEALKEDSSVIMQTKTGLKSQTVILGIRSDTDVEIKQGLNEEDSVLLNPPSENSKLPRQNNNPLGGVFRIFQGGRR